MYTTQEIATAIKKTAKKNGIALNELLTQCGLNINAISEFSKGKQMSVISFAKIADVLECSVDFLLGRLQNANAHKGETEVEELSEEQRLVAAFRKLTDEAKKAVLQNVEVTAEIPQYQKYTDISKEA